jgi:choline dehydrogenase-like flavoprotein
VLPLFRRSEHNEQFTDAFHGQGGPLNVTYPRHDSPVNQMFQEAAQMHGLTANPDYNGAEQEGSFLYQVTQRDGERCSAAKAFLTPHLSRPNLKVHHAGRGGACAAGRPARHGHGLPPGRPACGRCARGARR